MDAEPNDAETSTGRPRAGIPLPPARTLYFACISRPAAAVRPAERHRRAVGAP